MSELRISRLSHISNFFFHLRVRGPVFRPYLPSVNTSECDLGDPRDCRAVPSSVAYASIQSNGGPTADRTRQAFYSLAHVNRPKIFLL